MSQNAGFGRVDQPFCSLGSRENIIYVGDDLVQVVPEEGQVPQFIVLRPRAYCGAPLMERNTSS